MSLNVTHFQVAAEKTNKQMVLLMNEVQAKLDEANRTLHDFDAAKKRLAVENADLLRQLEEAESQIGQLSRLKLSITNQLENTRKLADDECRVGFTKHVCSSNIRFWKNKNH